MSDQPGSKTLMGPDGEPVGEAKPAAQPPILSPDGESVFVDGQWQPWSEWEREQTSEIAAEKAGVTPSGEVAGPTEPTELVKAGAGSVTCASCWTTNASASKFCSQCGGPLSPAAQPRPQRHQVGTRSSRGAIAAGAVVVAVFLVVVVATFGHFVAGSSAGGTRVPSVVGLYHDAAVAKLKTAGLQVNTTGYNAGLGFVHAGACVLDTNPSAGSKVDRGTTVLLVFGAC